MPRIRFFDASANPTTIDGDAVSLLVIEDTRLSSDDNMGDEAFVYITEDPAYMTEASYYEDPWPLLDLQH